MLESCLKIGNKNCLINNQVTYRQLFRTIRLDVLVIYCCQRIRLGIISYEIHLLVTKTKSENSFFPSISVYYTFINIYKSVTFIFYNIKI